MATWPQGKRVAVCLTWDVDGEAAQYVRFPERAARHLSELHQRRYGPTVGIYKVLDLLSRYQVPGTFYIPGYTARQHPEMVRAIHSANHPIGLHGYLHEALDNLDEPAEAAVLLRARAVIADLIGYQPTLYRAPSWELNRWTPNLLVANGVRSDSSLMDAEEPYLLSTPSGPLVEIPIQWLLDDAEYWLHTRANRDRPIADPDAVFRLWSTEFDGYYAHGGAFVLTLHPFVSGRWAYLSVVERLIRHIAGHPDVWWATIEDVTRWAEGQMAVGALATHESPPGVPVP